jgi:predicted GNAT family acetyltransferase
MRPRPPAFEPAAAHAVEDCYAEWFAYQSGIPHLEVHPDPDIHWIVSPGSAWSNCGVKLRLSSRNSAKRLDHILARYRKNGRGAGFSVSPFAEPANLEALFRARRLRCRKYFPGMYAALDSLPRLLAPKLPATFELVRDYDMFATHPHPSIGRVTTPIRRFAMASRRCLAQRRPQRTWEIVALADGVPVGISMIFASSEGVAGFFDVTVLENMRGRGVGAALMAHACRFARDQGCKAAILISSGMGYNMYCRAGFREVAKFGFWYAANP